MLAEAARALSLETLVLDPKPDAVAGRVTRHLVADWTDPAALAELAGSDVVTYEFENVPSEAVDRLQADVPVHPAPEALVIAGDRVDEKRFLQSLGIGTAPFAKVDDRADLDRAVAEIGLPAILKTRRFGYDGRGQRVLREGADLEAAWRELGGQPLILEGFVPFDREVSILAVRARDGELRTWPVTENVHVDGILHVSRAPAEGVSETLATTGAGALRAIMERLDYVGVLVVEFFQVGDRLVANEMACRVHNSGHWTIEGAATSQFENHMRAVAGLPLGPTDVEGFAAMVNLVGEVPSLDPLTDREGVFPHVYGKSPAPGRKLGHVTVTASTRSELEARIAAVLAVVGDRAARSGPER
jgi:5-(carboxyamino)imidazole ribonucleotide synthase